MKRLLAGCILAVIVISSLAATAHDQEGSDVPRRKTHPSLGAERRESLIRPQDDSNTLEENASREMILSGDGYLLHKRDRSPPISIKYSSLSIEAELARAKSVSRAIMAEGCPSNEENLFNITVYTADLKLAGTTSRVYINIYGMLYGLQESTPKLHLTNDISKEFKRGRVDSFLVKTRFIGLVDRITIEHDNTGISPDWNLDKVVVHDLKLGTVQTYSCSCELAGYENEVTLPPI